MKRTVSKTDVPHSGRARPRSADDCAVSLRSDLLLHTSALTKEALLLSQASLPNPPRIESWLASEPACCLPPNSPLDNEIERGRAMSNRNESPKRRKPNVADQVHPEQSASQLGSTPLALNTKNTFGPYPSRLTSSRSRSESPSKTLATGQNQLILFTPPVSFTGLDSALSDLHIPDSLLSLVKQFEFASATKLSIQLNEDDETKLNIIISDVVHQASKYRPLSPPEPHWISVVVGPLLHLLEALSAFSKQDHSGNANLNVLNISTTEISPRHLCMLSSLGIMADLNKKIDYAVGLQLSQKTIKSLGYAQMLSINQTSAFMNYTPMFLNVEVKRYGSARNPRVQLAAWVAAEFNKRQREGWSLDMPVLALEIEQDIWTLHIVAAQVHKRIPGGFGLNFVGPFRVGDTFSESSTRKLFSNLCEIALWGQGLFRQWVETEILTKYAD